MPKKGVSNNPAGRPPGIPNKVTSTVRDTIESFFDKNYPAKRMAEDWNKLSEIERMKIYVDLMPYRAPKLQMSKIETTIRSGEVKNLSSEDLDNLIYQLTEISNGNKK